MALQLVCRENGDPEKLYHLPKMTQLKDSKGEQESRSSGGISHWLPSWLSIAGSCFTQTTLSSSLSG